eukprot:COSAG02_NODE_1581_length_11839_cov_9.055451_5_plen_153_part_00
MQLLVGTEQVITFQFGLHGLARDQERLTVRDYSLLLRNITLTLKAHAHGAKLLFVTTTPVPTNATDPMSSLVNPPRFDTDVQDFNAAAKKVMGAENVPYLDLYTFVHSHCTRQGQTKDYENCDWQLPNNVHFTPAGWTALATKVATAVQKLL